MWWSAATAQDRRVKTTEGDMAANTDADSGDVLKKAVLSNADYLNKLLIFSIVLLLTLIALKFQTKTTFQLGQLELRIQDSWLAVLALTISHRILAGYFRGSIISFMKDEPYEKCKRLFDEITIAGPPIFRGLLPKARLRPDSRIYLLSLKDPTAWVYIFSIMLIPLACISLQHRTTYATVTQIAIALYLLVWNWTIGSSWAILIGKLGTKIELSEYELRAIRGAYSYESKFPDMREANQLLWKITRSILEIIFYVIGSILIVIYYYHS
jgi:hypothetical protein